MTHQKKWAVLFLAIASFATTLALPTYANTVSTASSGGQLYSNEVTANPSRCEASNSQVQIAVKQPLAAITYTVSGSSGQPTLLIVDNVTGRDNCVMAEAGNSSVELTAAWEGNPNGNHTYSVYVGEYNGQASQFTLTIRQN